MSETITKEELLELESKPKTKQEIFIDRVICFLPIVAGVLAILEYWFIENEGSQQQTMNYVYFLLIFIAGSTIYFIASLFSKKAFARLRYKAPFHTLVYVLLIIYDVMTLKTGRLTLPYFPWVDAIINAMIDDRAYLLDSILNSLKLLFTGYGWGVALGLITGIICGYSKRVNYWLAPFMSLIGAIPTITWIPIVMVLVTSLFTGAVFIIALGVWFSVSLSTIAGIHNISRSYYEAAQVLGANDQQLIRRVTIPGAMPNIFQGLTQAMSTACTALIFAEMVGVESGLGWYVTWQRNWAQYDKMYAAIVIICLIFVTVKFLLDKIKRYVLKWQEGSV